MERSIMQNGRVLLQDRPLMCTHFSLKASKYFGNSCRFHSRHIGDKNSSIEAFCPYKSSRQSVVLHAAATESTDVDDLEAELEEEMDSAFEEGVDVDVMPGKAAGQHAGRRAQRQEDSGSRRKQEDSFSTRILQISRVTKVVKGGKQISFRAVVAVGDLEGSVGVGTASAKEIAMAVRKGVIDAQNHLITIPLTRGFSFPHKVNGIAGGAKVMLRPASEGTGVIAGGAVREVLELSGVKNGFGKQLGSDNPLNNARATIDGLQQMRTLRMAAKNRDLTVEQMLGTQ